MHDYTLAHLSDAVLLRDLAALVAQDRLTTATLLAHIAEVDARRLYVPGGYPSMHAYCVEELRLSEDAASKRIQAARAARQFPALFAALADGRLHLSAVCLLAPHLTDKNAGELIEGATHRRKSEIEGLLARRFPPPEVPALVRALVAAAPGLLQHAPGHVGGEGSAPFGTFDEHAPGHVGSEFPEGVGTTDHLLAPGQVEGKRAASGPASPERYLLQVTIGASTQEKIRYAQALLSHAVPMGDVAQLLDRALDALILLHEKRKFRAITRPPRRHGTTARKRPQDTTARKRYVPAPVRRAVWERDEGQCTFVSASGHRCAARRFLEFDHVEPVARGGKATVEGMRLRCRAHNQYEAERAFGADFMRRKRHEARVAAVEARVVAAEARAGAGTHARVQVAAGEERARAAAKEQTQDILAGLRGLGCRVAEARRAAEFSEGLEGATLEERMRASLQFLHRKSGPGHPASGIMGA